MLNCYPKGDNSTGKKKCIFSADVAFWAGEHAFML